LNLTEFIYKVIRENKKEKQIEVFAIIAYSSILFLNYFDVSFDLKNPIYYQMMAQKAKSVEVTDEILTEVIKFLE
jgi:hypothetical protein